MRKRSGYRNPNHFYRGADGRTGGQSIQSIVGKSRSSTLKSGQTQGRSKVDFVFVAGRGRAGSVKPALWRMKLLPASIVEAFSVHSLRIKGGGAEEGPRRTGPICIVDLEQQTNGLLCLCLFFFRPTWKFPGPFVTVTLSFPSFLSFAARLLACLSMSAASLY